MVLTDLQAYCLQLLENGGNEQRIFGYIHYAPISYFSGSSEWFLRGDGTIDPNGLIFKANKNWLRLTQSAYSSRLQVQQSRDQQGVFYKTSLTGRFSPQSADVMRTLHQMAKLPMVVFVTTANGSYLLGSPDYALRFSYNYDSNEKHYFSWSNTSSQYPSGLSGVAVTTPPTLPGIPSGGGNIQAIIDAIFGTALYKNDDEAKAAGRDIGQFYLLSMDNDYSFDLYRMPKKILE